MATFFYKPMEDFLPIHNDIFFKVNNISNPDTTKVYWYANIQYPNSVLGTETTPKFYYSPNRLNGDSVTFNVKDVLESYLKIDYSNLFQTVYPTVFANCNDYIIVDIHIGERNISGAETDMDFTKNYILFDGYFEDWQFKQQSDHYCNIPTGIMLQAPYNQVLGVPEYPEARRDFEQSNDWDSIEWNGPYHMAFADGLRLSAFLPFHIPIHPYDINSRSYWLQLVVRCKDGQYKVKEKDITADLNNNRNYDNIKSFYFNEYSLNQGIIWDNQTIPAGKNPYIDWSEDYRYAVFIWINAGLGMRRALTRPILFGPACSPYGDRFRHFTIGYKTLQSSWQTIPFTTSSTVKDNKSNEEYNQYIGFMDDGYIMQSPDRTVLRNEVKRTLTLRTDWLNTYQIKQIEDMICSKHVYVLQPTKRNNFPPDMTIGFTDDVEWQPVIVKNTNYEIQYKNQDKLVRYNIDFEYSKNKVR